MSNFARIVVAIVSVAGLSACLGSGNGGGGAAPGTGAGGTGGTGGGTPAAAFSANYDAVTAPSLSNAPTSDMPTSLNASYSGQLKVDVNDGSAIGTAYGDLDVDVAWTDGQSTNPFSGTASNFSGTLVSGQTGTIDGTLSVDDSFGGTIGRVVTTIPLPVGGSVTTATGAASFTMRGDLSVDGTDYDTTLLLGGAFHRPGGTAIHGPVSGGVKEKGTGGAIFDAAAGGTFYLIRD